MPAEEPLLTLTPLAAADPHDIETLLDAAFGADRRARTAYRLREGVAWLPELSFAAWAGDRLAGTLQSWPVMLSSADGEERLVMVGPVAVAPERQGTGVGTALMNRLIEAAAEAGETALMMIGDPDYYGRWGFTADRTAGWRIDGRYEQHRLLARLNRPVPLSGTLHPFRHPRKSGNPAVLATA
jgi:predicted N-acetyltransferase YhbS